MPALAMQQPTLRTFSAPNVAALQRVNTLSRTLRDMGCKVLVTQVGDDSIPRRPSIQIATPVADAVLTQLLNVGKSYVPRRRTEAGLIASVLLSGVEVYWLISEVAA